MREGLVLLPNLLDDVRSHGEVTSGSSKPLPYRGWCRNREVTWRGDEREQQAVGLRILTVFF